MTETQLKPIGPKTKRAEPSLRLCRRGMEASLPAILSDEGRVSRSELLERACGVFSELDGTDASLIQLDLSSRGDLLAGLLGCWVAGKEVQLSARSQLFSPGERYQGGARLLSELPPKVSCSEEFRQKVTAAIPAAQPLVRLMTSGSSGAPQLHQKTAGQLLSEASMLGRMMQLSPESVVFPTVAGHHLYGLLFGVLAPWLAGASLDDSRVSHPEHFHPEEVARRMHGIRATHWISVPAHLVTFAQRGAQLLGLREIVSSAAVLSPGGAQALEELTGARVRDILGSTETGGIATRLTSRQELWTPLPGVYVAVSDEGRLLVDSPYSSLPPWAPTGDRAELVESERFRHLGREDGIIKVGGRRLSLFEIEAAARSIPGVIDAVAARQATAGLRGVRSWLFVESEMTAAEVRGALRRRLEAAFVPRRIRVLARLPRDERGKVSRAVLERLMEEGSV